MYRQSMDMNYDDWGGGGAWLGLSRLASFFPLPFCSYSPLPPVCSPPMGAINSCLFPFPKFPADVTLASLCRLLLFYE